MIVKAVSHEKGEFFLECKQFTAETKSFSTQEELEVLQNLWGNWQVPFYFDYDEKKDGKVQVLVVQAAGGDNYTSIFKDCFVFIMNNDGKTIDRYNI